MRTIKLTEETRKDLLEKLLKRSPNCYGEYERPGPTEIVRHASTGRGRQGAVRLHRAVSTGQRSRAENIRVTEDEIKKRPTEEVDPELFVRHPEALWSTSVPTMRNS